ncbi:MAG: 50S ribosomal protein L29 [Clostridiales bacterium]|nr:50S ribosomal protein L29 [Clostridiales bacterium]
MKAVKIRELTNEELASELNELKSELFKLRFQYATNQLENPIKIKDVKRDIARVKTIIRERDLEVATK